MNISCKTAKGLVALGILAVPVTATLSAQQVPAPVAQHSTQQASDDTHVDPIPVYGENPVEGPEIEGFISARSGELMQVASANGTRTTIAINQDTEIKGKGGFLGLSRKSLGADALLNGLPVTVETVQAGNTLYASKVRLSNNDLEMAEMIRTGTAQGFAEQTAATEALRGRVGDIDKYNIKGTTNVYFDTNDWQLSGSDETQLCSAVNQAHEMDNALLLVVGYTDADGPQEYNQKLSERRAGRVVNHIQQAYGWQPWRMLTPTGMAEADPAADNMTEQGKAQNRRVAVNILVSKATEGL